MSSPMCNSNREIVSLEQRVRSRIGRRVRDFQVVPRNEGIVLLGRAPSYHAKQLAQHEVMQQTDLLLVANEITVVPPAPSADEPFVRTL